MVRGDADVVWKMSQRKNEASSSRGSDANGRRQTERYGIRDLFDHARRICHRHYYPEDDSNHIGRGDLGCSWLSISSLVFWTTVSTQPAIANETSRRGNSRMRSTRRFHPLAILVILLQGMPLCASFTASTVSRWKTRDWERSGCFKRRCDQEVFSLKGTRPSRAFPPRLRSKSEDDLEFEEMTEEMTDEMLAEIEAGQPSEWAVMKEVR